MGAVVLPSVGILIVSTLIIIFFSKRSLNSYETKIYKLLLIITFIFLSVGLVTFFVAKSTNNFSYIAICQRIYMCILVILNFLSLMYCLLLFDNKELNIFKIVLFCVSIIFILLILYLPLNVIFYDDFLDGDGLAYDIAIVDTVISFICFIIISSFLVIKKYSVKKVLPFIVLICLYVVAFFIRKYYKELIFEGFFYSYILFIMYHTIENPDLKMLEEYNKNKELVEAGFEERSNMLFKITQEVKMPIREIKICSDNFLNHNSKLKNDVDIVKISQLSGDLLNTVNYSLGISYLDRSNVRVYNSSYNIYNLFSQIIYIVKSKTNSKINLKYSISNVIPNQLSGDYLRIKQIICSLILYGNNKTNSVVDLDISSIIKYDVCRLIITVRNSKCDLNPSEINDIMSSDVLIKGKRSDDLNYYSSDLKLIKKLINLLDGAFLIKDDDNGTTFTVIIDQQIINDNKVNYMDLVIKKISNKRKVLLVDDDYSELYKISNEFKKNNFDVASVLYDRDCIELLKKNEKFDLIVIDDEMVNCSAVELIGEIQKLNISDLKIIVMLEKNKESIKKHYLMDYPFVDYLLKNSYIDEIKRISNKY